MRKETQKLKLLEENIRIAGFQSVRFKRLTSGAKVECWKKEMTRKGSKENDFLTLGNHEENQNPDDWFLPITNRTVEGVGVRLKSGLALRKFSNNLVILDGDLKDESDSLEMMKAFKKLGLYKGVELHKKKAQFHACVLMSTSDINTMAAQGRILIGNSFIEVFTAGKFLRLAPNPDYQAKYDGENVDFIDFTDLQTLDLEILRSLGKENITFNSKNIEKRKRTRTISNIKKEIDGMEHLNTFNTSVENLFDNYIKNEIKKGTLDYTKCIDVTNALAYGGLREVFINMIAYMRDAKYGEQYNLEGIYETQKGDIGKIIYDEFKNTKILNDYITKEDILNLEEGKLIVRASTGAGKTTSVLATNRYKKIIFVSPLNSLSNQLLEKYSGWLNVINCTTRENVVKRSIIDHYNKGDSMVISYKMFFENFDLLTTSGNGYDIYIDEAHFLFEESIENIKLLRNVNTNLNIRLLTATAGYLKDLLENFKYTEINTNVIYKRSLDFLTPKTQKMTYEAHLGGIVDFKKNVPLIVLLNDKKLCGIMKNELTKLNYKVVVYNSNKKDIKVIEGCFDKKFDILLTTTALTTGVSLYPELDFLYIPKFTIQDNINTFEQFFSRSRITKKIIRCGILKKRYENEWNNINNYIVKKEDLKMIEANKAHISYSDVILKKLSQILAFCNPENLVNYLDDSYILNKKWVHTDDIYVEEKTTHKVLKEEEMKMIWDKMKPFKGNGQKNANFEKMMRIRHKESDVVTSEVLEYISKKVFLDDDKLYYFLRDEKVDNIYSKIVAEDTKQTKYDFSKFIGKQFKKKEFVEYCKKEYNMNKIAFKNADSLAIFLKYRGLEVKQVRINGERTRILLEN